MILYLQENKTQIITSYITSNKALLAMAFIL